MFIFGNVYFLRMLSLTSEATGKIEAKISTNYICGISPNNESAISKDMALFQI
jgi:hypothetical protein